MKIVFLDFDGVLNNYAMLDQARGPGAGIFSSDAIERLNSIVERTGAKIVVISSWRALYGLDAMKALLLSEGVTGEVLAYTPSLEEATAPVPDVAPGHTRCREIQAWLDGLPEPPESFVILDDIELESLAAWHVKPDAETGLLDVHVAAAIAILGAN